MRSAVAHLRLSAERSAEPTTLLYNWPVSTVDATRFKMVFRVHLDFSEAFLTIVKGYVTQN